DLESSSRVFLFALIHAGLVPLGGLFLDSKPGAVGICHRLLHDLFTLVEFHFDIPNPLKLEITCVSIQRDHVMLVLIKRSVPL
uniref:Uncharacterized protein n=1 Tax=Cannabis sativa TaxID=3483 RepID=A0A803QSK8_CANSA